MTKKILSLLLTFCVLLSCFAVTASAAQVVYPKEATITEEDFGIAYFMFDLSVHPKALVGYDKDGNIKTFDKNPFVLGDTYSADLVYYQMDLHCVNKTPDAFSANGCTFETPYLVLVSDYDLYFAFDGEKIILPNIGDSYGEGAKLTLSIKRTHPTLVPSETLEYSMKSDNTVFNDGTTDFQILDAYFVCDENGQPLKFEENPFEVGKYYYCPNFTLAPKLLCSEEPVTDAKKKEKMYGHEFEGPYLKFELPYDFEGETEYVCQYIGFENGYLIMPQKIYSYGYATTLRVSPLTENKMRMEKGTVLPLDHIIGPEVTEWTSRLFSTDNTNIATITNENLLNAVKVGETILRLETTLVDGTVLNTYIPLEVYASVTEITAEDVILNVGENKNVNAVILPEDASNKEVTYVCADESIATVDSEGNVTGIKPGTTTVTVTSKENSDVFTTVNVTVNQPVLNITAEDVVLNVGENKNVNAVVLPEDASNKEVTYICANENIAIVDAKGNVTGVAPGTTTIVITSGNTKTFVTATVLARPTHKIVFGKTDGIGWYNVSRDGGETFETVFGNSTLEVEEGTELIIKCGDLMGESFTFYINGDAVKPDENGYITINVDGYMLIGALSMDIEVPDVEESISLIEKIINAIKAFFDMIANMFK